MLHQACLLALAALLPQSEPARLLRFPHVQGDKLAFVYGGDIWTASSSGGPARRVTSFAEGFELYPRISPDGEWIAFSGEYTGTRQIWLVPYAGGVPRQLTFYPDVGQLPPRGGYDNLPLEWSADGQRILIRTNRTPFDERISRYYWVDPFGGGLEVPLEQIPEGGPASLSPDGTKLAYNIISREWRTWKRYRAGRAQDIHVYDLERDTIEQITDWAGTDNFPMWIGERIYFTSDRSGTLNLYRYDLASRETAQITHSTDYDVLFPSHGAGGIVYQLNGELWLMDAVTEEPRKLEITLSDDRPWLRPRWVGTEQSPIGGYDLSPAAKRAVIEFRGELFDAPAEKGRVRNLTESPGRRERGPQWSPDGLWISYLAESGEDYELFVRSMRDGSERQLTHGTGAWILNARWSPDSRSLLLTDKQNRVSVVDAATGALRVLDASDESTIDGATWSGDSGWIAYLKTGANGFRSVWVASADGAVAPARVTTDAYQHSSPAFDPKGRYLYFVSQRDFDFESREFEGRLYALLLRSDVPSPLAPEDDVEPATNGEEQEGDEGGDGDDGRGGQEAEESGEDPGEGSGGEEGGGDGEEGGGEADGEEAVEPLRIELEGIEARLVALPGEPGDYGNLEAVEGGLVFDQGEDLKRYDLEERKSETILEKVTDYELTPDGEKLIYRHERGLCIAKAEPGQTPGKDPLPLGELRVRVEPQVEWAQMYFDAWRIMRDWFYDPAMHGVDWVAMREKYRPLVEHVAHRDDLDFLLGELIGELNAGHTYVRSGESPRVPRVPVGVLGAELVADGGRYRIAKIYSGRGWNAAERSPLAEPGVDARAGDYLIAIDGDEVTTANNPYRFLENKAGVQVTLRLAASRDGSDAREVTVLPAESELKLRYLDWVEENRAIVDRLSGGRVGYVHVPNTSVEGHRELWEGFLPLARSKQALIVDDRYNGGGFVPADMIALLAMPVLNYWSERGTQPAPTPETGFDGPMAMLINGYSSSGGDAFPYYFRKLGLGPLIGKLTWGGLIGYSGSPSLVDGGGLSVPSFAFINTEGQWDVEAVGVKPDIEVFDDPTLLQAGREPMLEAAVEYLLAELEKRPPPARPARPEGPDRSR